MKATMIPRHVSATMTAAECFDLIYTLRAAVRDFENLPESIEPMLESLTALIEHEERPHGGGTAVA